MAVVGIRDTVTRPSAASSVISIALSLVNLYPFTMLPKLVLLLLPLAATAKAAFVHPGLLHTENDFTRMKNYVATKTEPQNTDWHLLLNNSHAQLTYEANPQPTIYRGTDGVHAENYPILYNDAAAA
jgi:hypothetical protein